MSKYTQLHSKRLIDIRGIEHLKRRNNEEHISMEMEREEKE